MNIEDEDEVSAARARARDELNKTLEPLHKQMEANRAFNKKLAKAGLQAMDSETKEKVLSEVQDCQDSLVQLRDILAKLAAYEESLPKLSVENKALKDKIALLESASSVKLKFAPTEIETASKFISKLLTMPDSKAIVSITAEYGFMQEEVVLSSRRDDEEGLAVVLRVVSYAIKNRLA